MFRKTVMLWAVCTLLLLALATGCAQQPAPAPSTEAETGTGAEAPAPPAKDKIVFGSVHSISGPLAIIEEAAFGPIRELWVEDVNARGGIYVEEYGKQLSVELIEYDDKSDIGTMTRLLEKLILEDQVDFILPPTGTAMLYAAAPIADKHGYILPGMSGGAKSIKEIISGLPYFFSNLNYSDTQVPPFVELAGELGIETAAILFIEDLHGAEYSGAAVPALAQKGIDVVFVKSIPPGIKDMSSILKEAQATDVDLLMCLAYPDENILCVSQCMELGFNPKAMIFGPGVCYGFFKDIFGAEGVEGLMSWGAWNERSTPESKEFLDKFIARFGESMVDWWGHNLYWAGIQILEQAIERAGTLDHAVIREIMATEKFDTVLGETYYDGNRMLAAECHTGEVGQWQNGKFEVIAPRDKATADAVYPKPGWPGQ
jgi:branched-chain amino acid transport system substrate-binding protein